MQFRIQNKIIGVNWFLKKMNIKESDKCVFCKCESETVFHLFYECVYVQEFLNKLEDFLDLSFTYAVEINPETASFGIANFSMIYKPINCILLIAREFIYSSKMNNKN